MLKSGDIQQAATIRMISNLASSSRFLNELLAVFSVSKALFTDISTSQISL